VREDAGDLTREKSVSSSTVHVKNEQGEKVGRNDPCPCGSGKKYKSCGLINSEEHQRNISK
jgi:preprotein translocase subunit SecA